MKTPLVGALLVFGLSCGPSNNSDPSMDLTGTESEPLVSANGTLSCPGSKDLICHFPPGNRANMHSICVGKPAWPPHRDQHGDTLGACASTTTGGGNGGGGTDAGSGPGGDADAGSGGTGGTGGTGGACGNTGAVCSASHPCCAGLLCNAGTCSQSGQ